ncbi:ABC transporter substrate-binding protein [Caballeronia glebae]|jgi:ABC-type nitrate/sulfonate/bicarbonate transport system substrate-binding protein|uniref:ABC transporter substrate-binding protein n=1 Tax=Caballeronia glebae TaxID=1777143 RepID=UPI0038BCE35F
MQTLLLAHGSALSNLPLFVAIDAGIFAARGIRAEAPELAAFKSTAALLRTGTASIGTTGFTQALVDHALPDPLRIVAGSGKLGMALVGRAGLDVSRLRGQRVGTFADDPMEALLFDALRIHGIGMDDVECVRFSTLGNAVSDLRSGRIAALTVVEPWISRFQAQGFNVLCDGLEAWDGEYPDTVLVARASFLAEHPDVVREVIGCMLDAEALIKRDPQAAVRASAHRWPAFSHDELMTGIARQPPAVDIRPLAQSVLARAPALEALARMHITSRLPDILAFDLLDELLDHRHAASSH